MQGKVRTNNRQAAKERCNTYLSLHIYRQYEHANILL